MYIYRQEAVFPGSGSTTSGTSPLNSLVRRLKFRFLLDTSWGGGVSGREACICLGEKSQVTCFSA